MMDKNKELIEVVEDVKAAISEYCRKRVNLVMCSEDDCEWCPFQKAYNMAQEDIDDSEEE